jgi:hypothetical protein
VRRRCVHWSPLPYEACVVFWTTASETRE